MDSYNSDSDDGGDRPYTETSVLLGYATKEPTGDTTKLGGVPDWIDGRTAPSGTLAKCKVCNDFMSLLLQVNGDMPERFPGHERRLYVLGCRRKTCRRKDGSIRGIRGCRVAKPSVAQKKPISVEEPAKLSVDIGATLFGTKTSGAIGPINPFSTNTQSALTNPFAAMSSMASKTPQKPDDTLPETFASKVRISSPQPPAVPRPHEPWPTADKLPHPYPEFYLDAEYETLSAPPTPKISKSDLAIEAGESSSGGGAEDKDLFESVMDKTFQIFADRLQANPDQVLRYEWALGPLLANDKDAVAKLLGAGSQKSGAKITSQKRCMNCGNATVFEVQLTPAAITALEEDEMGIDGMEWITIIIGVCSVDCSPNDVAEGAVFYLEETCFVQWEELAGK